MHAKDCHGQICKERKAKTCPLVGNLFISNPGPPWCNVDMKELIRYRPFIYVCRHDKAQATLGMKLKRYRVPQSIGKVVFMYNWDEECQGYKRVSQCDKVKYLLYQTLAKNSISLLQATWS